MSNYQTSLIQTDLKHIWHPCAQMKDYETLKPIAIKSASGSYVELQCGKKLIDGNSSWWCKSLGHNHPRLKAALYAQIDKFEHVSLTHTTNETIVTLSQKLAGLTQTLHKAFYASDGSCAVEIALKMSLQAQQIAGQPQRNKFISLENAYHGETAGAMSISDLGMYKKAYAAMLFPVDFISDIPYVSGVEDPLWADCSEHWERIEKFLEPLADTCSAVIIEPMLQGAGNMKIFSQDLLRRLRRWTQERGIHLIVDEILTGMGRTGKLLASEYAAIEGDFLCLSKGLTAGWLPLSVVLTRDDIYHLFYDDYAAGKSFLHSHTFTGNALAASVAVEVLNILEEENIPARANVVGKVLRENMQEVADHTGELKNIRQFGGMVAADLICDAGTRRGFEIYCKAMELGAMLRPLGNTIYWFPPLNVEMQTLTELKNITLQAMI